MGTSLNISYKLCVFSFILLSSTAFGLSTSVHENFLKCVSSNSQTSVPIYAPNNSSYSSILDSTIQNLRFLSPTTPKPLLVITPLDETHVQAAVTCSRKHGFQIKTRSGGHDYDGLSYISDVPFVIVDMTNLRSISVDAEDNTAWVQSGATVGELFYRIAEKSKTLAFPLGICPTMGIGGHLTGGGYGFMLRKYGLAADHVIDAKIVNVDGKILNKETMGEDLFWAIRGGGGASFGIILSWKIRLLPVPATVTVFGIDKTLEEGATELVHRWQSVANKLADELFIRVVLTSVNASKKGERTVRATFVSLFLGDTDKLVNEMNGKFPELGLERKNCAEMSWDQSELYFWGFPVEGPLDVLLDRTQPKSFYKIKSDYVTEPISKIGLEKIWRFLVEKEEASIKLNPYGGIMNEIPENQLPFPHRGGNLYKIQYVVDWKEEGSKTSMNVNWLRRLYKFMTPYVSKSPRASYLNYRDIDLGQTKNGTATYLQAKVWGSKYFKNNFDRLVHVKTTVDPTNFFRNEQSIPSLAL